MLQPGSGHGCISPSTWRTLSKDEAVEMVPAPNVEQALSVAGCAWLPGGHGALNPHVYGSRAVLSTARGHPHPCPRVSLLPARFCVCPILASARSASGPGRFGEGLCAARGVLMGGRMWPSPTGSPVPSTVLWDPCREPSLVPEVQQEAGAGFPLRQRPPPPPGKARRGGWQHPQMSGTSGGHRSS